MSKLFEISADILAIVEQQDEVPQTTEALEQALNSLQIEFQDKALGVVHFVLNETADIDAIGIEIGRLVKMKQSKENRIEWLKAYLKTQMEIVGKDKIQTPLRKIAIQNNPKSVKINDENIIPDAYKKFTVTLSDSKYLQDVLIAAPDSKVDMTISKTKIKEALEQGVGVNGAEIIQGTRLVIK
jgi:hypothetical protein